MMTMHATSAHTARAPELVKFLRGCLRSLVISEPEAAAYRQVLAELIHVVEYEARLEAVAGRLVQVVAELRWTEASSALRNNATQRALIVIDQAQELGIGPVSEGIVAVSIDPPPVGEHRLDDVGNVYEFQHVTEAGRFAVSRVGRWADETYYPAVEVAQACRITGQPVGTWLPGALTPFCPETWVALKPVEPPTPSPSSEDK